MNVLRWSIESNLKSSQCTSVHLSYSQIPTPGPSTIGDDPSLPRKSVEEDVDDQLPTSVWPNLDFLLAMIRVFAYFPPPRLLQPFDKDFDISDLSFQTWYFKDLYPEKEWRNYVDQTFSQQVRENNVGIEYVLQASQLIHKICQALQGIPDPGKRKKEGDRLAMLIGQLQAAVLGWARHIYLDFDHPDKFQLPDTPQSGHKILGIWSTRPPWPGFEEKRKEGKVSWLVEQSRETESGAIAWMTLWGWPDPTPHRASIQQPIKGPNSRSTHGRERRGAL